MSTREYFETTCSFHTEFVFWQKNKKFRGVIWFKVAVLTYFQPILLKWNISWKWVKKTHPFTDIICKFSDFDYTVRPLYRGHLRFLKKVSAVRRCPRYRVLNFFKNKIILDKNLTMFYVNCDSLELHFSKKYG